MSPSLLTRYKEQRAVNKAIEKQLKDEKKIMDRELKILLLGTGDRGKSTVVKQMKILHLDGYPQKKRINQKQFIYRNIIEIAYAIIRGCSVLNLVIPPQFEPICSNIEDIYESKNYTNLDKNILKGIAELSKNESFTYAANNSGAHFQLHSSSQYFLDDIQRFSEDDYIPTDQDILYTRVASTSVSETRFAVRGIKFRMIDVAGQRGHRDKWIHHFSEVTAILFVISLCEYDQVLEEDGKTNRMIESIKVFGDIINQRWFKDIPIILFLNKRDLFAEKIKKTGINICFPDYTGPSDDYEQSYVFLKKKILSVNKTSKPVYTNVTTATDTTNIGHVFEAVKDILTRQTMEEGGI
ncbi:G-protein subunit alpha 7 [Dictyostelium purpureum]|uniref:G-protein subunit alpha 7 n=1 Tax=Dictyostelium purpureum TaxID=5786 RepID=F0ZPV5_DICPU|nr:G-protein subunit alpha 7 [Dictyostelium purpureum]EGC34045.1 G-protein subunit alpha 7 [Dictyostelium purpureum]|eukprot:XP_003289449.1 G-protein subunit alpha 7 [Dictyostelium purpureum]